MVRECINRISRAHDFSYRFGLVVRRFTELAVSGRHRSGSSAVPVADPRAYRPGGSGSCLSRCGTGSDNGTARNLKNRGKVAVNGMFNKLFL